MGVLTAITGVFTDLGTWIISFLTSMVSVFWNATDGTLTFLGVLAVASLAISVFFLVMGVIQNFLHFRG